MKFIATGDSFITRRLPKDNDFKRLAGLIQQADVRFTNLETTVHRMESFPSAQSGGTWAVSPPEVLGDMKDYGFNLVAWANNHTLDYSYGGLEATKRYLDQYGFIHAGVGSDLAEASKVRYLETTEGRVAMIAATTTFHESWIAGESRPDVMGRPGVNPMRYQTTYHVAPDQLEMLKAISKTSGINLEREKSIRDGFAVEDSQGSFSFGQYQFQAADASVESPQGAVTKPHANDLKRMLDAVKEAARQADYVLVSIHSHEMKDGQNDVSADFLVEVSRACIDAGAHAILGHGPHVVRAIEYYKNRPIFYSLGNFIFQNETVDRLPADFYHKYGLDFTHNTADAYDARSLNGKRGLGTHPDVWKSIVAEWTMKDGELQNVTLHPIDLGFHLPRYRMGWPRLTEDRSVIDDIQRLSRDFGTSIT